MVDGFERSLARFDESGESGTIDELYGRFSFLLQQIVNSTLVG